MTICLQLRYRGVSAETSAHRLTPDERGFFTNSIIHTLGRLISKKSAPLSRERKQFTHYTDLLLQLKEDRASLLYSQQGARIPITVYCRSMEELDEIWARYQSGKLQDELQLYFDQLHLPFGPVSVDVKIYNYEECKRKFRFAGQSRLRGALLNALMMILIYTGSHKYIFEGFGVCDVAGVRQALISNRPRSWRRQVGWPRHTWTWMSGIESC